MFAYQASTIIPDILLLSKTLGAGLPLAAVCTSPAISAALAEKGYMYYTTHLNDPLVCAVGAKVCEIVKRDDVCRVAREKGAIFRAGLSKVCHCFHTTSRWRDSSRLVEATLSPYHPNEPSSEAINQH